VLGHSYGEIDRIAKAVPNQLGIKLDEAIVTSSQLREMYEGDPAVHRVVDFAKQLEGVARNASTHAAGVVISREPLTDLMPLQRATNSDSLMTQYEMHGVEALGLLKFDFLGLSNLTILRQAVDLILQERGGERIDIDHIPLDDTRTFELLSSGETTGVFQLESAGMRRYIRELRPTSVYDLAAMVALFRPGPMDHIPAYIRRKHGLEPVSYLHPLLQPFMEKTYGIFVYQEDIMAAAIALGGFTGPEADTLGYAIRKKKSDVLRAQKGKFVSQAAERGVEPGVIDAVFKAFEPFERYGFNKAHATCYGLIAYQTAYLKANYTVEYMTAVLTAFRSNEEKVAAAIAECRRMGIEIKLPDVHHSDVEFTVEGPAIRFGLLAVKNVGQSAIESIVAARKEGGPFKSLTDLCSRIDLRLVNRKVLEALAKVGALNALGHPAQVLLGLDDAINAGQAATRDRLSGQTSLFDLGADDATALERPLPFATEVPVRERLRWEKELLGLYLSEHPMGEVAEQVGQYVTAFSSDLKDESLDGQRVVIGGIVTGFRRVITKANATMGVATLEDLQGTIEVVVFPRMYELTAATWTEGTILLVAGRIDHRGDDVSLLADLAVDWDGAITRGPEAFAREVSAGDRGRGGRRGGGANGNGNGWSNGGGPGQRPATDRPAPVPVMATSPMPEPGWGPVGVAVGPGAPPPAAARPDEIRPGVPRVSPLRAEAQIGGDLPRIVPAEPIPTYDEPAGFVGAAASGGGFDDADVEPALPDEARARAAQASQAPTSQIASQPDQVLHVRFGGATSDRLVLAMETFKNLLRERPGGTRVVLHVPAPTGGGSLPMELSRRVAYDAELLSEVRRRLGEGLVDLTLG
ncbi:MAG TPA: DNA polymerase III subunit alpha, partial [Candidatus Limnocylindrales bacterium]|nr:DNA polymerase III subunit alpha [Candidatus Limnocylindrales bacterium]